MATTSETKTPAPAADKENKEQRLIEFVPFGTKDKISLSIAIVKRLIAVKTKTGKTCSDEDAFKFMLMCQARKLNPFEGDAYLIGYDSQSGPSFSLITAHQAFLKRAEVHNEFDGMESGTIVLRNGEVIDLVGDWHMPNDNVLGGWATVFFKNRAHPMKKRLRLARFNKGFGIWRDDPAGMIVKCAEADALRSSFPTMLGGMFISEELPVERATEIAHAQFPEGETTAKTNGDPVSTTERTVTRAEVVEPTKPEQTKTTTPEKKAAAAAPQRTLQRRAKSAAPPTQAPPEKTEARSTTGDDREKLKSMLAIGNCTTEDFVSAAVDEGWIDAEIGSWDKIPDGRFAEFLKAENWALVMEVLDDRKSKTAAPATTTSAKPGELL
jgi:phage recombination protein Bet